mgnify:CR=1 FL=1
MGVEVQVERIGENDIQTRAAAAIMSRSGPDIIMLQNNFPHLLANGLIEPLEGIDPAMLGIYARDALHAIRAGDPAWESLVPLHIINVA